MTSHYKFIADETALERDLSESCAEIARLQSEVATLRAREARVRAELTRLSESPSLACQTVAACVLAILDDDGKDGEG